MTIAKKVSESIMISSYEQNKKPSKKHMINYSIDLTNKPYVTKFAKRVEYVHSFKTHFSVPSVIYINAPTGYVFTTAES